MNNSLDEDFQDFLNSNDNIPPEHIDMKIQSFVRQELEPNHSIVFLKLLTVQTFIGLLTLLFCPQFELSLTNNHELYHYFHFTLGTYGCFAICGALFIGTGAMFASYILGPGELRRIRNNKILYYFSITAIAVSMFLLFGAKVYLITASIWFMGAILGGIAMLEFNIFFRQTVLKF